MSVHKLAKYDTDYPYTRIPNSTINHEMSLKALGLLTFMLSKPDGWTFTERGLLSQLRVGRHALATAMNELIANNYVRRTSHMENGLRRWVTEVYDTPCLDNQQRHASVSDASEIQALSKELRSNKDEEGADAPEARGKVVDSEPGTEQPLNDAASKNKGKASERAITDDSYASRLLDELGDAAPDLDAERLADNYLTLFGVAKKAGRNVDGVAIGLTLGLLVKTFGPLPGQARGMLARLVKVNGPTAVMHAAVTTAGSTIGADRKYADDPLGPVRYLSGVVRGNK